MGRDLRPFAIGRKGFLHHIRQTLVNEPAAAPRSRTMQTRNPILDEVAKLTTGAMGLAQAAGEEAKTAFRAGTDRMAAELDLVRRDEFDALRAEVAALRAELAQLKTPVAGSTDLGTPAGDAAG
jgi:BMFP domain-containing protein YqiC